MVKVTVLNNEMVALGHTTFADAYTAQVFIDACIEGGTLVKVEVL